MSEAATEPRPTAGMISFLLGALSLLIVLGHFWAGPLAPQQKASVTVGEIAADIRAAALRKLKGQPQPAPEAAPWDADRLVQLAAAVIAGLAIIAALAGFVRHEAWRPAAAGAALAVGAITFQFLTWMVLVLVGGIILYAIITNIDGILGG